MQKLIFILFIGFAAFASNAQEIDRSKLRDAGGSLERFANMNHTANVLTWSGIGISTLGSFAAMNSEPISEPLLFIGPALGLAGWIVSRRANKHIRRAGYQLQSADSGIGIKLVF